MTQKPKYSSTFIFETGDLTDEFHRIDSEIATRARQIPGFLGEGRSGDGEEAAARVGGTTPTHQGGQDGPD